MGQTTNRGGTFCRAVCLAEADCLVCPRHCENHRPLRDGDSGHSNQWSMQQLMVNEPFLTKWVHKNDISATENWPWPGAGSTPGAVLSI